jgi:catechol 2,3-dioxygenase-like lactoylglutathione lyase family enzyme
VQVRAVDFVAVSVPDMATARAFYRDRLGLKETAAFGDEWVELDAGNVTIALVAEEAPPGGGVTLALAVPDVAEALDRLRSQGVTVLEERQEYPPCFMAAVADPFGHRIYLHQRKDGTAG